jgi:hypothetical protein
MPQATTDFFQQQRQWAEAAQMAGQCLWQSATEIAQLNAKSFGYSLPILSTWAKDRATSQADGVPTDAARTASTPEAGAYWQQLIGILNKTQTELGRLMTEQAGAWQSQLTQTLVTAPTTLSQQPWFPKAGAQIPTA